MNADAALDTIELHYRLPGPIDVKGIGRASGSGREMNFTASGCLIRIDKDGTDIRWTGSKGNRPVVDWFWSRDPKLADHRQAFLRHAKKIHRLAVA
jgi:hypothetical protein